LPPSITSSPRKRVPTTYSSPTALLQLVVRSGLQMRADFRVVCVEPFVVRERRRESLTMSIGDREKSVEVLVRLGPSTDRKEIDDLDEQLRLPVALLADSIHESL
jgi:hypothetical protein